MKLAVANNVGQQFSTEGKAIYYEVVADGYDFSGNAKIDVTNYDDLRLFWAMGTMTAAEFRDSVQGYWQVVGSGVNAPISPREIAALYKVKDQLPSGISIPSFSNPYSPSPDFGSHEIQQSLNLVSGSMEVLSGYVAGIGIPYVVVQNTDFTTSSCGYIKISGYSQTPPSGRYYVSHNGSAAMGSNNQSMWDAFYTGEAIVNDTEVLFANSDKYDTFATTNQAVFSVNGATEVSCRFRTSGTLTVKSRSLVLIKLS